MKLGVVYRVHCGMHESTDDDKCGHTPQANLTPCGAGPVAFRQMLAGKSDASIDEWQSESIPYYACTGSHACTCDPDTTSARLHVVRCAGPSVTEMSVRLHEMPASCACELHATTTDDGGAGCAGELLLKALRHAGNVFLYSPNMPQEDRAATAVPTQPEGGCFLPVVTDRAPTATACAATPGAGCRSE